MIGKMYIIDRIEIVIYTFNPRISYYRSYTLKSNQTEKIKLIYNYPTHTHDLQCVKNIYHNTTIGKITVIGLHNTYFECIKFIKVI